MYGQGADFPGWLCNFGYLMPGPFGMLFTILIWAAVVFLIVKAVQSLFFSTKRSEVSNSMRILADRYAAGEISRAEFEQIKKDIG